MLLKWKDLIKNVNLKVLYEKEIIINHNFKPPSSELQDTWWNGMLLFYNKLFFKCFT